mmetsp:Transcript_2519/g.7413  ORF Transcript_2519/g.7413 Transcript_2519/m.7413 type:complete len:387 (+) Transcript_2519:97-1257(+)
MHNTPPAPLCLPRRQGCHEQHALDQVVIVELLIGHGVPFAVQHLRQPCQREELTRLLSTHLARHLHICQQVVQRGRGHLTLHRWVESCKHLGHVFRHRLAAIKPLSGHAQEGGQVDPWVELGLQQEHLQHVIARDHTQRVQRVPQLAPVQKSVLVIIERREDATQLLQLVLVQLGACARPPSTARVCGATAGSGGHRNRRRTPCGARPAEATPHRPGPTCAAGTDGAGLARPAEPCTEVSQWTSWPHGGRARRSGAQRRGWLRSAIWGGTPCRLRPASSVCSAVCVRFHVEPHALDRLRHGGIHHEHGGRSPLAVRADLAGALVARPSRLGGHQLHPRQATASCGLLADPLGRGWRGGCGRRSIRRASARRSLFLRRRLAGGRLRH